MTLMTPFTTGRVMTEGKHEDRKEELLVTHNTSSTSEEESNIDGGQNPDKSTEEVPELGKINEELGHAKVCFFVYLQNDVYRYAYLSVRRKYAARFYLVASSGRRVSFL